jgi:hypothetical protein
MKRGFGLLAIILAGCLRGATIEGAWASPPDETADADIVVVEGPASVLPSVALVGGGGAFGFASSVCGLASAEGPGTDSGEPLPDAEAGDLCTVGASGQYGNIVCGTGVAAGSGTITEWGGSDNYTVTGFTASFFAGVGVLSGVVTESDADGSGDIQPIYGLVLLVPQAPPPVGACVSQFTAVAALATDA